MEGTTDFKTAKIILGKNFVGPDELFLIHDRIGIKNPFELGSIPEIPYSSFKLKSLADDFILILGIPQNSNGRPLSLVEMRSFFGVNPDEKEPCFYNQDWYLKEHFANECSIEFRWYLLRRNLIDSTRGKNAESQTVVSSDGLPSALLCAYTFFSYYFYTKEFLWKTDFVWCSDLDSNGDRIYVARYFDPLKINKNGFSIHRHLRIRENYGCVNLIGS